VPPPPPAADLKWTGVLGVYDEDYDRVIARLPRKLRRFENSHFFFKTAQDDPVLAGYASEGVGNVIATDAVLAHLMTCTRSVYPWDIVANYVNGFVILDVRDPLEFELHSVNETANDMPKEGASSCWEFGTGRSAARTRSPLTPNFPPHTPQSTRRT
jgi:translation initiation factor 3 subunit D